MSHNRRRLSIANLTDFPIPPRNYQDKLYAHIMRQMGRALDASFPLPVQAKYPEGSILDVLRAQRL